MPSSSRVAELLRAGIAAAKAGRTQEARQALLQVTELDERNELAWLWLSGVVESLDDRRVCLESVLAINPGNAFAQAGLRWLDRRSPVDTTAQERCPRCQAYVSLLETACPQCGQVLIVACPACGRYVDVGEVSCPECGQTLGDFRDGARYHLALAQAYLERHRHLQAREAAARAEAAAADDARALEGLAALYEKMGESDQAIAAYERAIRHDPENAALYVRLGAIYRQRAMPVRARRVYEQAVERVGDDPAILFELAQVHLGLGEEEEAQHGLKLLEQVVRLEPGHASAHLLLGDAYLNQRRVAQALRHYERACELTGSDSRVGQEARRRLRLSLPDRLAQGWGETLRQMGGLMLIPMLAALINAGLVPWQISLAAWMALLVASAGAYLWVCATGVPRNPAMRAAFGHAGVEGLWWQALVGLPGALLWTAALGAIFLKV